MTAADAGPAAASYSTGGGGVVLEHQYGASLLACLLTGDPVSELGDDATPMAVRFQASAVSAVDDLLVLGRTPDGDARQVSVGVRRAPRLVRSEEKSVSLIASYLRVVIGSWEEVLVGRWRLALAVSSPNNAVKQAGGLAEIAQATSSEEAFRAEVEQSVHDQGLRDRLGHLDALVAAALQRGVDARGAAADELTWRFLFSLRVRELRLEGADTTDRTAAVTRLRVIAADGTAAAADSLFSKLAGLADRYAPAGADVTEATLRRDLSGTPLARSPSYPGG